MKKVLVIASLWFGLSCLALASKISNEGEMMSANGTFEVDLKPQDDASTPAGRIIINKIYQGDMKGSGIGQMISKRTDAGAAVYYAIEEFSGSINGKNGAFTLVHNGHMDKESQTLLVTVLEGSGSGELKNISGTMIIVQGDGGHSYELTYDL